MTKNPYDVLGISRNASEDEIKRAYKDLSRKYHPDTNVDNPLADLAEERFKEVQEAYDAIMKEREGSQGGFGYQYRGGQQNAYDGQQQSVEMQAAFNYINSRHYREAMNVLDSISDRNAQWYYASAYANAGLGNNVVAREHAAQAVNMEPGNPQYQQLLNQMSWNSQRYQNNPYGGGYGRQGSSCGTGNMCCDICIADSLCECMGGDLCACM